MESPIAKRPKMSEHEINEPTQTSSDTKIEVDEDGKPIELDVDEDKRCLKEVQPRSKNFNLYQGKNIFEDKEFVIKYFGKYPTIYVNVGHRSWDFEGIFSGLKWDIHEAFRKHAYLRNSSLWNRPGYDKEIFMKYLDSEKSKSLSEEELQSGLKILSKCLHGYYEAEVMDLLKKAGKFEKFNEIKEKYNGYKTTLEDGRLIQIYSPYAILQSLKDVEKGVNYISNRIQDGISHVKITPKILKLMSGECVQDVMVY
ncbi:hypothetical protein PV326_010889 [Microctonus aethiopoides]|nr:hypothetical protein PV326_010889 [Microctonus aethiopoides]